MICINCNCEDITTYTREGKSCCGDKTTSYNECNDCKAVWKETAENTCSNNKISPLNQFVRNLMSMEREDWDEVDEEMYGNGKKVAFLESCKHMNEEEIWKKIGEDIYGNGREAAFVEHYERMLKDRKATTNKVKQDSCKVKEPTIAELCNDIVESLEKIIPFMKKLEASLPVEAKRSAQS